MRPLAMQPVVWPTSALARSLAPQSPQNLALGGLRLPQDGHGNGIGAPHSMQKRLPSGTFAWQLGHSMPHLHLQRWPAYHTSI